MRKPGRPRSVPIDYERLDDLRAREYGARRIARELHCSVSTAKRLLSGRRPETSEDAELLRAARAAAGSASRLKAVGSDPGPAGRGRNPRSGPPRRVIPADAGPPPAVDDWSVAMAKEMLESVWNKECEADFLGVVAKLAASLRRHPSQDLKRATWRYQQQLGLVAIERAAWLSRAERDLDQRWRGELRALEPSRKELESFDAYWADSDATEQFERLDELLTRRLATLRTGSSYYDIVDVLVAEGARRHEPTLRRLVRKARAARAAEEEGS